MTPDESLDQWPVKCYEPFRGDSHMGKALLLGVILLAGTAARAGIQCLSTDGATHLELGFHFWGPTAALHSRDVRSYYHLAHGLDISGLQLVKDGPANGVLERRLESYRGLLWAPTSGSDLVWFFELNLPSPARDSAELHLTDPSGHAFRFSVRCRTLPDFVRRPNPLVP